MSPMCKSHFELSLLLTTIYTTFLQLIVHQFFLFSLTIEGSFSFASESAINTMSSALHMLLRYWLIWMMCWKRKEIFLSNEVDDIFAAFEHQFLCCKCDTVNTREAKMGNVFICSVFSRHWCNMPSLVSNTKNSRQWKTSSEN